MEDTKKALERAKAVLNGISMNNFNAALGNGCIEDSAFFMIGQALGEIDYAIIAINAHEEVYGFPRCSRPCVDRRAS